MFCEATYPSFTDATEPFWTPVILVPLISGLFGYKAPVQAFWVGSFAGIVSTILWNGYVESSVQIEGALIGIVANLLAFIWIAKGNEKSDSATTDECISKKAA